MFRPNTKQCGKYSYKLRQCGGSAAELPNHWQLMWMIGTMVMLAGGCNSGSNLRRVWGEVRFEGQPIEEGTIEFSPIGDTGGSIAGAVIRNGAYDVPQAHGVLAGGSYKVAIVAMKKTGRTVPGFSGPDGKPLPEFENAIPRTFNSASKLTVTISADESNNFNLHLLKVGLDVAGLGDNRGRVHYD